MKLLSIQVGEPREIIYRGHSIRTSIYKVPILGPVHVGQFNIYGDRQSDLSVHGGLDKAVYGYSFEAYNWWKNIRPDLKFEFGAFGENLTFANLEENKIYIGDTFEIGKSILQVTQPRMPCYKLGVKFEDPSVIKAFMQSKRPGVYFRVLKQGIIEAGNELKLIAREQVLVSVLELFSLATGSGADRGRLLEILQVKALPDSWRNEIQDQI